MSNPLPAGAEPIERIQCQWCQGMNEKAALTCRSCGAPLDIRNLVSESGWREAPRIKDMTEFQFSTSTCQVEGEIVPVAEINLGPGDSVFFEHHLMLWKEDAVPLTTLQLPGGLKRAFAGMPFIISVATGPGRIAFSRDATGELVVLPLHPGMEVDVREHAFLLASHQIDYSFVRIKGFANILFGGQGMFMDRFVTTNTPGLLMLHGYGNVFERTLKPGESIMLEPGAFSIQGFVGDDGGGVSKAWDGIFRRDQHVAGEDDGAGAVRHPVDVRASSHRVVGKRSERRNVLFELWNRIAGQREFLRVVRGAK